MTISLKYLSLMLNEHYGKKVIILMDEYDAPIMHDKYERRIYLLNDIRDERLDLLEEDYQKIALESFSYFDTDKIYGERFYHGFTLGILYQLGNNYSIKSNRETGYGRSDILVIKKDKSVGFIFEFKESRREEDIEKETKEGLKQIEKKNYTLELKDIKKVYKVAIAFSGKEIKILYK